MATDIYVRLTYDQYKAFEAALKKFEELETAHTSTEGFYHKSFRLPVGDISLEVHGPIVKSG